MSVIYEPRGKAREYSPLAINLYRGCNHGCDYCYVPPILYMKKVEFHSSVNPRKNILSEIDRSCKKFRNSQSQVFFSFTTDPYNKLEKDEELTNYSLHKFLENKIPAAILTKSTLVRRDIDLIKKFGNHIQVGMTLTFFDKNKSMEIEPQAATPEERVNTLKFFKEAGVRTWASIEPVIEPDESLAIMMAASEYVDVFKIGMVSGYKGLTKSTDWSSFLHKAVDYLRGIGKEFYVKSELRKVVTDIKFSKSESSMDYHAVKGW